MGAKSQVLVSSKNVEVKAVPRCLLESADNVGWQFADNVGWDI